METRLTFKSIKREDTAVSKEANIMEVEFYEGPHDGLVLDVLEPGESYYFPTGRKSPSGSPIKSIYIRRENFVEVVDSPWGSGEFSAKIWYYIWKGYGKSGSKVRGD